MRAQSCLQLLIACGLALGPPSPAVAQDAVADFYKGKQMSIMVGFSPGGSSSLYAQALSRHMGRYLPGAPNFIIQHVPGAGGLVLANNIYNTVARDGTAFAITGRTAAIEPLLGNANAKFDGRRFGWIGTANVEYTTCTMWHTARVKTLADAMTTEAIVGGSGADATEVVFPKAANKLVGTKFKIVMGYPTSPAVDLAMERGEVQARGGASLAGMLQEHGDWIREKKIIALVQVGSVREKDYPDLPLMHELAKTPEQRQVLSLVSSPPSLGRPFLTTPDVPPERVAALKYAFAETMKDEAFLAEAKQLGLDMNPMTGEAVTQIVNDTINAPADAITNAKVAIEPSGGSGGSKQGE